MGVEPFLVSAAVRAFLAQRLVRRLCPHCKVPRQISTQDIIDLEIPRDIPGQVYSPKGCDRCRMTGFSGRLAIYEVVILSQKMQELVAHSRPLAELKAQAFRDGYVPMRTYGWHKVMQGQTTIEEVISVTSLEIGGME
jgi:type II secretory ATPase GspE/PulE/Tfp pilus assembly ATPase PilB-like protein